LRELEQHVSMFFIVFLLVKYSNSKIKIFFKDVEVVPWDPFARNEKKVKVLEAKKFLIEKW
jgi:hypothetical protein